MTQHRPRGVVEGDLDLGDAPIGAPVLPLTRRDRFAVWLHEHRWAQIAARLSGGVVALCGAILVFGADVDWMHMVTFIVGAAFAGEAADHEDERGGTLLEEIRIISDSATRESIPAEFRGHVDRRPDPRNDGRYFGGGF